MKNNIGIFGIIAVSAIIGLLMAACDNGLLEEIIEKLQAENLTIAGTFASQNGGIEAKFSAKAGTGARSLARAIHETDFSLDGLLEDGDITFRLKGSYNSETKTYTLSAASSFLRYIIYGEFDTSGIATTGTATVQVNNNPLDPASGEWTTTEIAVTTTGTAPEIDASGEIIDETPGGIPANMRGIWRDASDASFYAMVNAFSVSIFEKAGGTWVEAETMFFTDVTTSGGVTSGVTAFMGWDWDAIVANTPDYWQKMLEDYAEDKYPGKKLVNNAWEIRNEYISTQMNLPDNQNQIKEMLKENGLYGRWSNLITDPDDPYYHSQLPYYPPEWYCPNLYQNQEWKFSYLVPNGMWEEFNADMANFNGEFQVFFNKAANDYNFPNYTLDSDDYRDDLAALLAKNAYLRQKYTITLFFDDSWQINGGGETQSQHEAFNLAITTAAETWGTQNGYLIMNEAMFNEFYGSGYEYQWLSDYFGKNQQYWCQYYSRMALKLQGGKIYWGNYYKPASGNPSDPMNFIPPSYDVKVYSQINTLSELEWEEYGLSR